VVTSLCGIFLKAKEGKKTQRILPKSFARFWVLYVKIFEKFLILKSGKE
jgi:hypothetical protein